MADATDNTPAAAGASALLRAIDEAKAITAAARTRGLDRTAEARLRAAWREADRLAQAALAGPDDETRRLARIWLETTPAPPAFDPLDTADTLSRITHRLACLQAAAEGLDGESRDAIVTVLEDARVELRGVVGVLGGG